MSHQDSKPLTHTRCRRGNVPTAPVLVSLHQYSEARVQRGSLLPLQCLQHAKRTVPRWENRPIACAWTILRMDLQLDTIGFVVPRVITHIACMYGGGGVAAPEPRGPGPHHTAHSHPGPRAARHETCSRSRSMWWTERQDSNFEFYIAPRMKSFAKIECEFLVPDEVTHSNFFPAPRLLGRGPYLATDCEVVCTWAGGPHCSTGAQENTTRVDKWLFKKQSSMPWFPFLSLSRKAKKKNNTHTHRNNHHSPGPLHTSSSDSDDMQISCRPDIRTNTGLFLVSQSSGLNLRCTKARRQTRGERMGTIVCTVSYPFVSCPLLGGTKIVTSLQFCQCVRGYLRQGVYRTVSCIRRTRV